MGPEQVSCTISCMDETTYHRVEVDGSRVLFCSGATHPPGDGESGRRYLTGVIWDSLQDDYVAPADVQLEPGAKLTWDTEAPLPARRSA